MPFGNTYSIVFAMEGAPLQTYICQRVASFGGVIFAKFVFVGKLLPKTGESTTVADASAEPQSGLSSP